MSGPREASAGATEPSPAERYHAAAARRAGRGRRALAWALGVALPLGALAGLGGAPWGHPAEAWLLGSVSLWNALVLLAPPERRDGTALALARGVAVGVCVHAGWRLAVLQAAALFVVVGGPVAALGEPPEARSGMLALAARAGLLWTPWLALVGTWIAAETPRGRRAVVAAAGATLTIAALLVLDARP